MPSCRVNECSNRSGGGVRLFSIPKRSRDVEIAKKWLKSVWDKELDDDQFALLMKEEFRVCAEHFVETDFDARGKLKADAVPSRFPWNGGQQRVSPQSKSKVLSADHKSNGLLVNKLTRALKAAESIVDGEIKDIDKWVLQLQAQVEHLRTKRERLVQHKAELGRSLSEFSKANNNSSSNSNYLSGTLKGQSSSSLNMATTSFLVNGTNYFLNNVNSGPGESLLAYSNDDIMPDLNNGSERKFSPKSLRRSFDEMERYSSTSDGLGHGYLTPQVTDINNTTNTEETAEATAFDAGAHVSNTRRQFATRRKNLRPTRVSITKRINNLTADGEDGDASANDTAVGDNNKNDLLPISDVAKEGADCEPSASQCDF